MAVPTPAVIERFSDRSFFVFNAVVSAVALAFIAYILMIREGSSPGGIDLSFLPAVNASLNALSALLLSAGWIAIRRRAVRVHQRLMVAAFAASAVFLVSYLVYHYAHGDTRYQGTGMLRVVYFLVLISHIVLSMTVVPMALTAFWFAARREFHRHRRLTRVALPIWLYVSVTGVLIYFMLRGSVAAIHPCRAERAVVAGPHAQARHPSRGAVRRADTFFIATAAPAAVPAGGSAAHGVDVSHRGGRPGFVRVSEERHETLLTVPDFLGNYMFNTVGNLMANPRAGLLFVDFESGDLLGLTGGAEVVWDGPELKTFSGAQRLLRVRVEAGCSAGGVLPLRWGPPEFSPHLEADQ